MSQPLTAATKADIVRLFALYKNKVKVARALKVSQFSVGKVLREHGLLQVCVDCQRPARRFRNRCDRCQRIRDRMKQRWWYRDKYQVPPENYKLENL